MKYAAPVLSMVALAAARPAFTNTAFNVEEGEPFTLEFTGCDGGCTINLQNGEKGDLQDVQELTGSASGGSFTVNLESIPSDTYTFQIINNETGEENWSQQFVYEGDAAPTTSAEATTTTTVEESTTSAPSTTTSEESTTTSASSTSESSMTTPSTSASTTSESSSSDESTPTDAPSETSSIPDPDDGAGSLAAPLSLVLAAAAGLFFLN